MLLCIMRIILNVNNNSITMMNFKQNKDAWKGSIFFWLNWVTFYGFYLIPLSEGNHRLEIIKMGIRYVLYFVTGLLK